MPRKLFELRLLYKPRHLWQKVSNEGVRAVRSRPEDFLEDVTRPTKNYPLFASLVEQQKLQAITLHSFGPRIGTLTTQIMRLHQMCLVVRFGSGSIYVKYFNEKRQRKEKRKKTSIFVFLIKLKLFSLRRFGHPFETLGVESKGADGFVLALQAINKLHIISPHCLFASYNVNVLNG